MSVVRPCEGDGSEVDVLLDEIVGLRKELHEGAQQRDKNRGEAARLEGELRAAKAALRMAEVGRAEAERSTVRREPPPSK